MEKAELCAFGKKIDHSLVDIGKTKEWLVARVHEDTELYFDRSYLHKIRIGKSNPRRITRSICKILEIEPPV
ncbi:MAG: XRE family transcriptional regulator [Ruthenibacterium sp.]